MSSSRSILVINPNTTLSMTEALIPLVDRLGFEKTLYEYFTPATGVASINNEEDASISAKACMSEFQRRQEWFLGFHGYLVCCYSNHPLVNAIRDFLSRDPDATQHRTVTGIFEASVAVCLQSLNTLPMTEAARFGIVSTGKQWESILGAAVADLLGSTNSSRYAGTETTGLNANELHETPRDEVDRRLNAATRRLLGKGAQAICLGCAGMAGMDATVRKACMEMLGDRKGGEIVIVDGVMAGLAYLEGALRGRL